MAFNWRFYTKHSWLGLIKWNKRVKLQCYFIVLMWANRMFYSCVYCSWYDVSIIIVFAHHCNCMIVNGRWISTREWILYYLKFFHCFPFHNLICYRPLFIQYSFPFPFIFLSYCFYPTFISDSFHIPVFLPLHTLICYRIPFLVHTLHYITLPKTNEAYLSIPTFFRIITVFRNLRNMPYSSLRTYFIEMING